MKNKLQYAYSITVFIGVLFTAYLMMNKDGTVAPLRAVSGPMYRTEAGSLDPAVNELFQMEDQLAKMPKDKEKLRTPSEANAQKFNE